MTAQVSTTGEGGLRAIVDNRKCQGFGVCKLVAPGLFDVGEDDGYAIVLMDPIPADHMEDARSAASQCPMNAIDVMPGSPS